MLKTRMVNYRFVLLSICVGLSSAQHVRAQDKGPAAHKPALTETTKADAASAESFDDRAFQYIQWQANLFAILMAIMLVCASAAYGVGIYVGYQRLKAQIQSTIDPVKRRYDRSLTEFNEAADILRKGVYESAIAFCQACQLGLKESGSDNAGPVVKAAFHRAVLTGARLQIQFGDDADRIAGSNTLSELGGHQDLLLLQRTLERDDLSAVARESLSKSLDRLKVERSPSASVARDANG